MPDELTELKARLRMYEDRYGVEPPDTPVADHPVETDPRPGAEAFKGCKDMACESVEHVVRTLATWVPAKDEQAPSVRVRAWCVDEEGRAVQGPDGEPIQADSRMTVAQGGVRAGRSLSDHIERFRAKVAKRCLRLAHELEFVEGLDIETEPEPKPAPEPEVAPEPEPEVVSPPAPRFHWSPDEPGDPSLLWVDTGQDPPVLKMHYSDEGWSMVTPIREP